MDRVRCLQTTMFVPGVAILASFVVCACSSQHGVPNEPDEDAALDEAAEDAGAPSAPAAGSRAAAGTAGGSAGSDSVTGTQAQAGAPANTGPAGAGGANAAAGSNAATPATNTAGTNAPASAPGGAPSNDPGAAGVTAPPGAPAAIIDCTRSGLTTLVDTYFKALEAHDPARAPISPSVKITENAEPRSVADGLWKTAGALGFHRNVLDTERCGTLTEAVLDVQGMPTVVGVRLQLENKLITEVETYISIPQPGGFPANPMGLANSASDDWASLLPPEQRRTRDELNEIADVYFESFTNVAAKPPFGVPCDLLANGSRDPNVNTCISVVVPPIPGVFVVTPVTKRRYPIADVEAGIAVGFGLATGNLLTFNMLKVVDGKIRHINTVFGTISASGTTGWD